MRPCTLWLMLLAGCGPPAGHYLTVDLLTDFTPGTDFAKIVVTLDSGAPTTLAVATVRGNLLTGARIYERAGLSGSVAVHVTLTDTRSGTIASRTSRVTLTTDYALTVVIARSCRDVVCPRSGDPPTATECNAGVCMAPGCSGDTCSMQCSGDGDCPATVACTVGRCTAGACLVAPLDARCAAGQHCDPALGCRDTTTTNPCGDGTCGGTETCTTCSGDCGACACIPNCGGRECGDNGCHGVCGTCGGSTTCDATGHCVTTSCTPSCAGRACGPDPVCGMSCGSCALGFSCDGVGHCQPPTCTPNCTGRSCGPDPTCGMSCGTCSLGMSCDGTGTCQPPACVPNCSGRACGPDPVCGTTCGSGCSATLVCDGAGQCVCPAGQTLCGSVCASCCPSTCTTTTMCGCGNSGLEINNYCYDGCGGFNVTANPAFTTCNLDASVAGTDNCGGPCTTNCLDNPGCGGCSDGGGAACSGPDRVVSGSDCGPATNGHCACL